MITKWELSNFKTFGKKTSIELEPLTILTGKNSSGKSTLIKSMLLIAQTLRNSISSRQLVLNGPLVKMGTIKDIRANSEKEIGISFSYNNRCDNNENVKHESKKIEYDLKFDNEGKLIFLHLHCTLQNDETADIRAKKATDDSSRMSIENINGKFIDEYDIIRSEIKNIDVILSHFLPISITSRFGYNYSKDKSKAKSLAVDIINNFPESIYERKDDMPLSVQNIIKNYLDAIYKNKEENENIKNILIKNKKEFTRLVVDSYIKSKFKNILDGDSPTLSSSNRKIIDYFSGSLKYLGPLRFLDSIYPFSLADDLNDVGITGEYTAYVIFENKHKKVEYINPNKLTGIFKGNSEVVENIPLDVAIAKYLNYLKVCKTIKVEEAGQSGYTLKITQSKDNEPRDLTQVGVGISQVLPIIVMGLIAEKGSTLIFEQPELHLHTEIQALLADFFVCMAYLGKQCIIETHSEPFIDRLRLRMCQQLLEKKEGLKKNIKIYYFQKKKNQTKVIPVEINEYANYSIWPDGFFDIRHYNNEEILTAINKKRLEEDNCESETPDAETSDD